MEEAAIPATREPEGHRLVRQVGRVEPERVDGPEDAAAAAEVEAAVGLPQADDRLLGQELERLVHSRGAVRIVPDTRRRRDPAGEGAVEDLLRESLDAGVVGDRQTVRVAMDLDPKPGGLENDRALVLEKARCDGRPVRHQDGRRPVRRHVVVGSELHAQHTRRPRGEPHPMPVAIRVFDPKHDATGCRLVVAGAYERRVHASRGSERRWIRREGRRRGRRVRHSARSTRPWRGRDTRPSRCRPGSRPPRR